MREIEPPTWRESGDLPLASYWFLFREWRRTIVWATVVVTALILIWANFITTPYYLAVSVLRPASQETMTGASGLLGGNSSAISSLSALVGNPLGGTASDAEEHMAILESYSFTLWVANTHKIVNPALRKGTLGKIIAWFSSTPYAPTPWETFKAYQRRLKVDYDDKAGNLTVGYLDPDPVVAQKVLGYFVDGLREKLRVRAVEWSRESVDSLTAQMAKTPDPMIQAAIAALVAQQIQQELTAEMQSTFAFITIEPPVTQGYPYWPPTVLLVAMSITLIPVTMCGLILFYEQVYKPIHNLTPSSRLKNLDERHDSPIAPEERRQAVRL